MNPAYLASKPIVSKPMTPAQTSMNQASMGASPTAIVPAWHTAVVVLILLGFSLAGALNRGRSLAGRAIGYVIVMVFEWATVASSGAA
jgi:hypothetical protein